MLKIACLGWGSLIWDPKELKTLGKEWFNDGPELPIEFTRISSDNRITLIIDKESNKRSSCLWILMDSKNLEEAILSLKKREKTPNTNAIHYIRASEVTQDEIKLVIKKWMASKDLDAVIWTGLSYSKKTNKERPSIDFLKYHLAQLSTDEFERASEYILKTPKQIVTEYRSDLEKEVKKLTPNYGRFKN